MLSNFLKHIAIGGDYRYGIDVSDLFVACEVSVSLPSPYMIQDKMPLSMPARDCAHSWFLCN